LRRTEKGKPSTSDSAPAAVTAPAPSGIDWPQLWGMLAAICTVVSTVVSFLNSISGGSSLSPRTITLLAAVALAIAALFHLRAVDARLSRRAYTLEPRLEQLARADMRFAWRWFSSAAVLAVLSFFIGSGLVLGLIGIAAAVAIYLNGIVIGADVARAERELLERPDSSCCARPTPLLPGTARLARLLGRQRPLGRVARRLALAMVVVFCSALVFAGLAAGALLSDPGNNQTDQETVEGGGKEGQSGGEAGGDGEVGTEVEVREFTYAELCTELPDPLEIEHGLGELFRHAGAVKAGCGGQALPVLDRPGVFIAEGICSGAMVTLAVASPGYSPVLLYGEPAELAKAEAEDGELLFVDGAEPASGEVDVIGTTTGNYVFARSSPYLRGGDEEALRCSEVNGTPRPFVRLVPPVAELWQEHVEFFGWAWPVERAGDNSGEITFVGYETGVDVAKAHCAGDFCELEGIGTGEHREYTGISWVSVPDLTRFAPPHAE
jgi:hypothetical protein